MNQLEQETHRPRNLQHDLEKLKTLAFKRYPICASVVREFHERREAVDAHPAAELLWNIYDWLLTPYSLWPIEFRGLAKFALENLQCSNANGNPAKREEKPQAQTAGQFFELLQLIDPPPPEETQSVIAEHERDVESGRYEKMLKQAQKFDEQEQALLQNEDLLADWNLLKRTFNLKRLQNRLGVIRRLMSQERGFREEKWRFDWSDELARFRTCFDAFCYRWRLYGMEHDKPLLLKISINATPHGTMIYIPRGWSLDPRRDLDWALINRLHRSRAPKRGGPKWSAGRVEKLELAEQVRQAYAEGRQQRLKGEKLHDFICERTGRDSRGDDTWWRRIVKPQSSTPNFKQKPGNP